MQAPEPTRRELLQRHLPGLLTALGCVQVAGQVLTCFEAPEGRPAPPVALLTKQVQPTAQRPPEQVAGAQ